MDKRQLYDKLKGMSYEDRAAYVDKVKQGAEGDEHWLLLQLEIDDLKDSLYNHLMSVTDSTKMPVVTAQLQGVEMVEKLLKTEWSTDNKEK